jgi:isoquinoline 1-oxidoreductase alpha subunit
MATITLNINGQNWTGDVADTTTPLLWVLRDLVGFTGTKFGCGVTVCSACVVLSNGSLTKTCTETVANFVGKKVVTIEGLAALPAAGSSGVTGKMLQDMWVTMQVPQCGYCQSGMLLAVYALLSKIAKPTDADINSAIANICACGTYPRVRAAIKTLTGQPVAA